MKYHRFTISLALLLGSLLALAAVVRQHSALTFGAVNGLPDPALDPRPGGLAINVALEQYPDLDPVFNSLTAFQWLRQTFPWDVIAPTQGQYDWAKWDALVEQAVAHDKKIIAVLSAQLPITNYQSPPTPSAFATFASAFATRYASAIDVYQIWDEPNLASGWGGQPSAAEYAALLQAAYTAIHAADPTATVLAAGLAPNTESGPKNYSDLLYLQQLYDLGANQFFDAASGKPYGFYTGPDDRAADPALLNFSRFTLLRQVMERNGDAHKLLWASHFGWNTHPDSIWGLATPEQQRDYTLAAYARAHAEWPWAGPLALENYQPTLPPDDPHWGFALFNADNQPTLLGENFKLQTSNPQLPITNYQFLSPGNYTASDPRLTYTGAWQFSPLGADIPEGYENARGEFTFQGTDLALTVRRADYRGYLYITIDGQPANRLPRDERGAYLVLTSPDLQPQVNTIPIATGLPDAVHTIVIQPERGWGQWALVGLSVGRQLQITNYFLLIAFLSLTLLISLFFTLRLARRRAWAAPLRAGWEKLGGAGQLAFTALVGGLLYLTSWLTFGNDLMAISRRFGDTAPLVVTALTAGLFYFSPSFLLALAALLALGVCFYLRMDLALAFTALVIPFYLQPRLLWQRGASVVEFTLALTVVAWLLQNIRPLLARVRERLSQSPHFTFNPQSLITNYFSSIDLALFSLAGFALLSVIFADLPALAFRDYRLVILEPVIFYFILRYTPLDEKQLWRVVDFFILGAVLVAGIGLYQYATHTNLIIAEGGVERIRSVYGSPNNLALYLGRALPVTLAVLLMGRIPNFKFQTSNFKSLISRRLLYGVATIILALTMVLTFSKGALFLGLPAALAVILIGWQGRRGAALVAGGVILLGAALPFLSQIPRFADLINPQSGTSFFRTQLWLSAWRMFLDHPLVGVGPDNFLYAYRSFYILPTAWQEPNLSHPHNVVLDYLTRLGLLGLAGGVALQLRFWRMATRAYRQQPSALALGLMASMAAALAHGLVDNSFFLVDLAYALCLTVGVMHHLKGEQ